MSQLRKPRDKQINDSKLWISTSYITLIKESINPESISISKIANKAGVSRQTLYRHFSTREEILDWFLEQEFNLFLNKNDDLINSDSYHIKNVTLVMDFFRENREFINVLVKFNMSHLLISKMEEFISRISKNLFPDLNKTERFYREKSFVGSLFMLMIGWLKRECKDSPSVIFNNLFLQP